MKALSMMVEKESGNINKNLFGSVWKVIDSCGSTKYELLLPPTQYFSFSATVLNDFLSPDTKTLSLDLRRPTFQNSVTVVFLLM